RVAEDFVDKYGLDAYGAMQGLSFSVGVSPPLTKTGYAWLAKHPEVREKYRWVYGLFAPSKKGEKIAPDAIADQLGEGERTGVFAADPTGNLYARLMNRRMGSFLYYQVRDRLPANLNPVQ